VLFGDPVLTLTSQGLPLRASPAVFYQVNLEVNALLVNYVCDQVRQLNPTRVLDLFSGLGNFGLPLAQSGIDVIAVEQPGRAIEDCRYSVAAASLGSRVQIMAMNVKRFDPTRSFFDVAIVDPPRAGTLGGLSKLLLNRPTDIFYVSCHLGAAAKEIRAAQQVGYQIAAVRCFDMFPNTHHFETVVHLKRT
jgi:23S rRNA (uracil1939-C5)-methyltransferase